MGRPVTVSIPHALGVAEARRRIESGFAELGKAIPGGMAEARQVWDGDRMSFSLQAMGQGLSGWLEVLADRVVMELNLPGVLGVLAGRIRSSVEKQGRLLLEKH
jgi:hypothetical protein